MERMERRKEKKRVGIKLWKNKYPEDLDKFYRDMLCEWKKYKKVKFHGESLMDDLEMMVEDCCFSRDDMLVVEMKADGGFILQPVEEVKLVS
jgi:hypothetical protein